jgi:hypothetical protein
MKNNPEAGLLIETSPNKVRFYWDILLLIALWIVKLQLGIFFSLLSHRAFSYQMKKQPTNAPYLLIQLFILLIPDMFPRSKTPSSGGRI